MDGKFLGVGGSYVPASQALCSSLLEECFEIVQEVKAREDSKNVSFGLKPIYDRLSEIRAELENLVFTRRWSLRETDLWNYTVSLQEIDKMRVDGKFVDAEGQVPAGQYVSIYPYIIFMSLCSLQLSGSFVSFKTMLRIDLSSTLIKRACFRGTHAYCEFTNILLSRSSYLQ